MRSSRKIVLQEFGVGSALGEGVLCVLGVVRSLRTSSNYATGLANTWLGCCTGVRCGSIPKSQHKQTLGVNYTTGDANTL